MVEDDALIKLNSKIDKLCNGVEMMRVMSAEMAEDITKIKEAVYNPDEGLYARIRELEAWKNTSSKMMWTLFTTTVGLVAAFVLKYISP